MVSPSVGPHPAGQSSSGTDIFDCAAAGGAASPTPSAITPTRTTELVSCLSIAGPSSSGRTVSIVRVRTSRGMATSFSALRELSSTGQIGLDFRRATVAPGTIASSTKPPAPTKKEDHARVPALLLCGGTIDDRDAAIARLAEPVAGGHPVA